MKLPKVQQDAAGDAAVAFNTGTEVQVSRRKWFCVRNLQSTKKKRLRRAFLWLPIALTYLAVVASAGCDSGDTRTGSYRDPTACRRWLVSKDGLGREQWRHCVD
jgi:hypothetical protein